jgi:hypothetical protein
VPAGVVTVLTVGLIVSTTVNVALWAFRPRSFRQDSRSRQRLGTILTTIWVIVLPAGAAVSLALSAGALDPGQSGAWPGIVTGAAAIACWPVAIVALRQRRAS